MLRRKPVRSQALPIARIRHLFAPRSIALVGASPRPGSTGRAMLDNLRRAGFPGAIHLVNPRHETIDSLPVAARLSELTERPDLALVVAPPEAAPGILEEAAGLGIPIAAIVGRGVLEQRPQDFDRALGIAVRAGTRVLGPDCLGVIAPRAKLDASFATALPQAGDLALVSQSGTIGAALVGWAARNGVGVSAAVAAGAMADIDLADLLDHFATDRETRSVLIAIETIGDPRRFLSAARAAARAKPVVVLKIAPDGERAASFPTHGAVLADPHAVHLAAFRRVGLLSVADLDEAFAAARALAHQRPFSGDRIAILANGLGIGRLAAERLRSLGGRLARPGAAACEALRPLMLRGERMNPIDLGGDADAARYGAALDALIADRETDAVLVMNCPTVLADPAAIATQVVARTRAAHAAGFVRKPVFAAWIGGSDAERQPLTDGGLPAYETESEAIEGLMHLVHHSQAQAELMETPPALPGDAPPEREKARAIVHAALAAGRSMLDPVELTGLLSAYAIPIAPALPAATPDEAAKISRGVLATNGSCAVKILSPDIPHKSAVGGVVLNLATPEAVRDAASTVIERAKAARPQARITGVTVHPFVHRPKARELVAALVDDSAFGPVVVFGRGGTAVELVADAAIALPPLDMRFARELIGRTRVSRQLVHHGDTPDADRDAIAALLVKLSRLAADIPEIVALDLNPVLADRDGVIAVDARACIAPSHDPRRPGACNPRFAIRPYPAEWERRMALKDGTPLMVRPVRPEDERLYPDFFAHVTPEDLRLRFFAPVREFSHAFIARLTQIDYSRAIAFVAIEEATGALLGVVRLHMDADFVEGEYAILLRSDLKGQGLGWKLMKLMIEYARVEGVKAVTGQILRENVTMLKMCEALGFRVEADPDDHDLKKVTLDVDAMEAARASEA
jgi:acetyltransferase